MNAVSLIVFTSAENDALSPNSVRMFARPTHRADPMPDQSVNA